MIQSFKSKQLLANTQALFLLNNLIENLNYKLINSSLKYLYTNPNNQKKEWIYLTSDRPTILNILDLKECEYLDNEDQDKASHYHLSRWISESKRFDSESFFRNLRNVSSIDTGLISDLGKIHKRSEPCVEFYWENKVLGTWFNKYVTSLLSENIIYEVVDKSLIEEIIGKVPENILNKASRFINSRFNHFLEINYQDIEKELKNWYVSL